MITDELLFRFLSRETSESENSRISAWLSGDPGHEDHLNQLKSTYESAMPGEPSVDTSTGWNNLETLLQPKPGVIRLRPALSIRWVRVAAVLILLAGSGLLWFFQMNTHVLRNNDLITKSVFLPDGTQVDLGPGARVVYGNEFLEGNREIRLTGDAYFDVTSDAGHPFTVIAGSAKIRVTGTQFVVSAPPGSKEVEVSVKSGNVLFYNSEILNKDSFRMGLVAGEKGIFYPALNRMDKTRDPYFQTTP